MPRLVALSCVYRSRPSAVVAVPDPLSEIHREAFISLVASLVVALGADGLYLPRCPPIGYVYPEVGILFFLDFHNRSLSVDF